jgi:hypothetical protein
LNSFAALAAILFVGTSGQNASAVVVPTPEVTVSVGGTTVPVTGWTWNATDEQWELESWQWSNAEGSVQATGLLDFDPSIAYGFTVTDFGAPTTFTFSTSMPIAPTGPGTSVNASLSGGLTDNNGNGVTLTPNPANGDPDGDGFIEAQIGQLGLGAIPNVNMGVDVGLAETHSGGGPSYTYGSYIAGPQPGPVGMWNSLGVTLSFTLSGGGDVASLTGFVEVVVPEPSSIVLGAFGALAIAGVVYRRKRAA